MAIVNAEDLRRSIIDGIQYVLDRPVRYWITSEQKRILTAQRAFWEGADQVTLGALFTKFQQASHAHEGHPPAEPDDAETTI